jgi:hypothetical protein
MCLEYQLVRRQILPVNKNVFWDATTVTAANGSTGAAGRGDTVSDY